MSSKRYYSTVSDDSSSSSLESDYQSNHKKRRKRSKHNKHKSKSKDKRHKRHQKKDRKFKSKSKYKHNDKHKDKHHKTKKRHQNDIDSDNYEPLHKKRKLSDNNPCTLNKELLQNAKTVLKMICNDDETKQYMINIFTKLDNKQSISISDHLQFKQALEMIFTFLLLNTSDNNTYHKTDQSLSLLRTFKKQLKLSKPIKSESNTFIGPSMPTNTDLLNNKYLSEQEQDLYGPALNKDSDKQRIAQMQHTKIIAEMNKKINCDDNDKDDIDNNDNKRPEWMTKIPTSLMNDYDKGTKERGFNQYKYKQDNSWTETPKDIKRQKKEIKRREKIQREYNEKLKNLGLPTIQQQNTKGFEEEEVTRNNIEIQERAKSLFEIHQEKLRQDFKQEMKEWKRRKKNGDKVGPKPTFKGAKALDRNASYAGTMDSYYNAQNPVFTRSKLNSFVSGGTIDDY